MKEKTDEWFYFNQLQNGALIPETVQNCLLLKQLTRRNIWYRHTLLLWYNGHARWPTHVLWHFLHSAGGGGTENNIGVQLNQQLMLQHPQHNFNFLVLKGMRGKQLYNRSKNTNHFYFISCFKLICTSTCAHRKYQQYKINIHFLALTVLNLLNWN